MGLFGKKKKEKQAPENKLTTDSFLPDLPDLNDANIAPQDNKLPQINDLPELPQLPQNNGSNFELPDFSDSPSSQSASKMPEIPDDFGGLPPMPTLSDEQTPDQSMPDFYSRQSQDAMQDQEESVEQEEPVQEEVEEPQTPPTQSVSWQDEQQEQEQLQFSAPIRQQTKSVKQKTTPSKQGNNELFLGIDDFKTAGICLEESLQTLSDVTKLLRSENTIIDKRFEHTTTLNKDMKAMNNALKQLDTIIFEGRK